MKKTKQIRATGVALRRVFTVMVAFLLVIGFNACSNGGGGGGPAGGPGVPSTGTGDNGGKYTNPKTGEDYKVGETGPGGGKIFYDSVEETGDYFTMTDNNDEVRYLEASLGVVSSGYRWASQELIGNGAVDDPNHFVNTGMAIGTGRKNTALIIAKDPNATAAKLCDDYKGGGLTDWFLPSEGELIILLKNITTDNGLYWSSSQTTNYNNAARMGVVSDAGYNGPADNNKSNELNVFAIRAF